MRKKGRDKGPLIISKNLEETPASFFDSLVLLSPRQIDEKLTEYGYCGQAAARKSLCLCAYRHMKRLYAIHVKGISREMLPPRSNAILMGPTGCGKSYVIELLFGKILNLPYVIVEMTRFTETGYVGEDALMILNRLVESARGNLEMAETGVIALDEFDKIASQSSNLIFGGGSTKDVSGYGVQRELLKMLEGADVDIMEDLGYLPYHGAHTTISTRDITFIGLGAFSGFNMRDAVIGSVGFVPHMQGPNGCELESGKAFEISDFQRYGFIPELIGRFERVIPFAALDAQTLSEILRDKLKRHILEFEEEGFELQVDDSVCSLFVEEAIRKETGARGLEAAIAKYIEDLRFEYFGQQKSGTVQLKMHRGELKAEVKLCA